MDVRRHLMSVRKCLIDFRKQAMNAFFIWGVLLMLVVPAWGGGNVSLAGMVFAVDWDEEGRITAVSVVTEKGEEYNVIPDAVGKELFLWEGETAELTGVAGADTEGRKTLQVVRYRIRK